MAQRCSTLGSTSGTKKQIEVKVDSVCTQPTCPCWWPSCRGCVKGPRPCSSSPHTLATCRRAWAVDRQGRGSCWPQAPCRREWRAHPATPPTLQWGRRTWSALGLQEQRAGSCWGHGVPRVALGARSLSGCCAPGQRGVRRRRTLQRELLSGPESPSLSSCRVLGTQTAAPSLVAPAL